MADPVTVGAAVGWGISAVGWVISPIISKLLNKGFSYLGSDGSEKPEELEKKVCKLVRMLGEVEESPDSHKDHLKKQLKELRSAFYEAEDFLDDVEYDRVERQILSQPDDAMPPRKRKRKLLKMLTSPWPKSSCLKQQVSGTTSDDTPLDMSKRMELQKILKKIENSINKADEFLQHLNLPSHLQRLDLQNGDANARRAVTIADPPPVVIGRDEDRDKIIAMLHETVGDGKQESNSALPYSIIGIHGIPGSGKTTLAQYVCAHEENGDHFDLVMWVHVTENFSVQTIWSAMFQEAAGKQCVQFNGGLNALQKHLKEGLRGKRFLLVLDDVWYDEDTIRQQELEQILSPLRVGKAGSKILVTSRTSDALLALGAVRRLPISDLDGNVFLELFMHYALEGAMIDDQNRRMFEMIGADIAKKLKRSPLAARIVGRRLRIRPNVEFWRSVRDRDLLNETMGALWWSYQHLDEQVRRCFAYCSMFPRRHQLRRDELVNLWAAEGFIKISNAGEQIEDIGQSYFHELVSCSFLQKTGRAGDSDTVCFTIHDLLYDLAERVAGSDCFTVLENNVEIPPTVRHLYIDSYNTMEIAEQICKLENLRTLIFTDIGQGITERVLDGMLNKLRRLRVVQVRLVSENYNLIAIPASIGNLKHLRCLSIHDDMSMGVDICLPSTFDKLYHLQILEYPSSNNLRGSCVRSINNLINLRHVKSSSTSDFFDDDGAALEIPGIGRLKSLQTLGCFGVRKEKGYELQQLEGLNHLQGILRIRGLGNVESKEQALEAKLADKEGLTSLALEYGGTGECPADRQADILEGLRPPSSVTQLRIQGYHGRTYPSWLLGNQNAQRNLQRLQLKHCHELKALPEIGEIFIHLHELRLESLRSLKYLPILPENMKKLVIKCCTSLAFICMEDVEMLRTMLVERASQADPSLKSVNPEGIAGFSPEQFNRFKATLYDLIRESGNSNSLSYNRSSYNLMLENVFRLVWGNCIEEDSQLLIPRSVEHLRIGLCTITDSALRNCLIGCTSITCLELSGILCLTSIPLEFLTKLRELSITECVALTILHGLNDLRKLENLTIKRCPNLKALQDSEKVGALCLLTVDDLPLVPDLLSTEGRSSLTELRIWESKERKEAEFLQQLASLNTLEVSYCDWDTLPENLVHLTSLEYLSILGCKEIQSLPVLPESLKYFTVDDCDPEFMDSCQTPGEPNWQKIEHVPTKKIDDRELP